MGIYASVACCSAAFRIYKYLVENWGLIRELLAGDSRDVTSRWWETTVRIDGALVLPLWSWGAIAFERQRLKVCDTQTPSVCAAQNMATCVPERSSFSSNLGSHVGLGLLSIPKPRYLAEPPAAPGQSAVLPQSGACNLKASLFPQLLVLWITVIALILPDHGFWGRFTQLLPLSLCELKQEQFYLSKEEIGIFLGFVSVIENVLHVRGRLCGEIAFTTQVEVLLGCE